MTTPKRDNTQRTNIPTERQHKHLQLHSRLVFVDIILIFHIQHTYVCIRPKRNREQAAHHFNFRTPTYEYRTHDTIQQHTLGGRTGGQAGAQPNRTPTLATHVPTLRRHIAEHCLRAWGVRASSGVRKSCLYSYSRRRYRYYCCSWMRHETHGPNRIYTRWFRHSTSSCFLLCLVLDRRRRLKVEGHRRKTKN